MVVAPSALTWPDGMLVHVVSPRAEYAVPAQRVGVALALEQEYPAGHCEQPDDPAVE